jgi:hypothetical protein
LSFAGTEAFFYKVLLFLLCKLVQSAIIFFMMRSFVMKRTIILGISLITVISVCAADGSRKEQDVDRGTDIYFTPVVQGQRKKERKVFSRNSAGERAVAEEDKEMEVVEKVIDLLAAQKPGRAAPSTRRIPGRFTFTGLTRSNTVLPFRTPQTTRPVDRYPGDGSGIAGALLGAVHDQEESRALDRFGSAVIAQRYAARESDDSDTDEF